MEHLKGFAKGFEKLRGGVFDLFSKQPTVNEEKEVPKRNIEYVDEMYEQSVPQYYPDIEELRMDNSSPYLDESSTFAPPPVSQSFIDVPIASVRDISVHMLKGTPLTNLQQQQQQSPHHDDDDDFMLIETKKISTACPYYYLPFSQSSELCSRLVNHWLEQTWFLPSDWKTSLKVHDAKPCYVPFFVFDVMTFSAFEADILVDPKEGNPATVKQWEVVSGHVESEYSEIIACGSCSVNLKLINKLLYQECGFSHHSQRVLPVDPRVYKPNLCFEEEILPLEITKDEAWEVTGKLRILEWEDQKSREKLKQRHEISSDKIKNLRVDTKFNSFQYSVILLPIYFAGFEYADHIYEVLVSGNRGVVVGNRPIGTGAGGKFLIDKIKSVGNLVVDTVPL